MTVGNNVHLTLASLRSAAGNLETFALETDNQQAKQMYHQSSQQLSQIVSQLESRVNSIEQQEPTYKISNTMQTGTQQDSSVQGTALNKNTAGTMISATEVSGKHNRTR